MNKDWKACAWLLLLPIVFLTFILFLLGFVVALLLDRLMSIIRIWRGKRPETGAQWEQDRLWDASPNEEASCSPGGDSSLNGQHEGVTFMAQTLPEASERGQDPAPVPTQPVIPHVLCEEASRQFARDLRKANRHFSQQECFRLHKVLQRYQEQQRQLIASGQASLAPAPSHDKGEQR